MRRLDELNAKAEDPTLWDDPEAAQTVMRERTRLDTAVTECRDLEQALADNLELVELGEAEGDALGLELGLKLGLPLGLSLGTFVVGDGVGRSVRRGSGFIEGDRVPTFTSSFPGSFFPPSHHG